MSQPGQDEGPRDGRRAGSGEMFDGIAERYDLLNRIISMGLDQGWRRRAVRSLELTPGAAVLDLATGTADLAIAIARTHDVKVIGIDPSQGMLTVGRRKVEAAGLAGRVELEVGDAEQLRLGDASVDGISMAFGIRNVPDRARALREMARVTRPGGRVAILELSEPRGGLMSKLARFHIHTVVPYIGGAISGRDEYRYLQDSIARFPPPDEFAELMRGAGLRVLRVEPLTMGVVCLFVATPEGG
ncbi:bifunctional demethylmenaquinone methyltransferase/2-methoxy-6-polyprenyl-1,4-benzoquinol methylase UbiE [Sorangium sp. So ce291]|uniref:bifunctional demethylmenaquinone methyltransferase/2-methoxy-6-polyprenyl-1,4-benzoquinol methylase UbiE n=1 Tax=Sorangium sp. So ce291 TaxID=3133294 RepID=UPI003F63A3CE